MGSNDEAGVAPGRNPLSRWILTRLARETSSGGFIPEIDGLRFVAIAMVVLFHLNGYLLAKSPRYHAAPPAADWLANAAFVGFRGVELFFVISGFVLALPFAGHYLQRKPAVNLRKYYLRRLTRLEPPYFAALFLLFFLAIWIQGRSATALYPHLLASLFYIHDLVFGHFSPFIMVAWSLEIEAQFYLLVPLLAIVFAIRNPGLRRAVVSLLIFAVLAGQSFFLHNSPRAQLSILAYLQFFLTGFLLADIHLAHWSGGQTKSWLWDGIALLAWPLLFVGLHSPVFTHWLFPAWVLLLYCATFCGPVANRFFSNRWITAVGGMCYSIYLLHYEVISAVGRVAKNLGASTPYWIYLITQFVIEGAAILLVCGVFFLLIEKPCMRKDWPQRLRQSVREHLPARIRIASVGAGD